MLRYFGGVCYIVRDKWNYDIRIEKDFLKWLYNVKVLFLKIDKFSYIKVKGLKVRKM